MASEVASDLSNGRRGRLQPMMPGMPMAAEGKNGKNEMLARMCMRSLLAWLICFMLGESCLAATQAGATGPLLQFTTPVYDFGRAFAGDLVEHAFEFTNAGDAKLVLTAIYPQCSCTTVGDWTREVAPGASGFVVLRLDTARFDGPVAEFALVGNNDRAHSNLALRFKGVVSKPVEVEPRLLVLRPALNGAAGATNSVRLVNHLPEALALEPPVSDKPFLSAELRTVVPGREFELTASTGPAGSTNLMQGLLSLRTSSARLPTLTVPVLIMPQSKPQLRAAATSSPVTNILISR